MAIEEAYSKGLMIALGVIFMVIPIIFVALRLVAKRLGNKGIWWDDYLCIGALVINTATCICQLIAAADGELGQHQVVGPDGMPILDDPHFLVYEKTKFAVNILIIIGLGLIKLSFLVFYLNIFQNRAFKIADYVMIGIVSFWIFAYFWTNLFTCYPITPLVEAFYQKKCMDSVTMWLSAIYSDIVLDFMVLALPVWPVLNLQMPLRQRLGVLGIFLLGACVCAISITRLEINLQIGAEFIYHYNDETYYTSPVFFWSTIEMGLAVISSCLPTLRPVWLYFFPSSNQTTASRYGRSYKHAQSGSSNGTSSRVGHGGVNLIFNKSQQKGHSRLDSTGGAEYEMHDGLRTTIKHKDDELGHTAAGTAPPGGILVERTIEQRTDARDMV